MYSDTQTNTTIFVKNYKNCFAREHCDTCRVNKTCPFDCSYRSFYEHNKLNDDKTFLKTRNVKKQHCFLLCKIIASQSLCRVFDSLFS